MISGVYHPYVFVKKDSTIVNYENIPTESDRGIFSVMDHLMGSQRRWGGIQNRLIPNDATGRIPGMGTAGMAPEEVRIRKFMESCTFKAMISCAGGKKKKRILKIFNFCIIKVLPLVLVLVYLQQVLIQCQQFKQQNLVKCLL